MLVEGAGGTRGADYVGRELRRPVPGARPRFDPSGEQSAGMPQRRGSLAMRPVAACVSPDYMLNDAAGENSPAARTNAASMRLLTATPCLGEVGHHARVPLEVCGRVLLSARS
jgi:hypothetical protein